MLKMYIVYLLLKKYEKISSTLSRITSLVYKDFQDIIMMQDINYICIPHFFCQNPFIQLLNLSLELK